MLGQIYGLTIKKNRIVNGLALGLFLGLFVGGLTLVGGNDSKDEGAHETGRSYVVVGLEREEDIIEDFLPSESGLIEAFLSGLKGEQRQDAVELLGVWLENNLDASPELRGAVESALEEERESSRGESSENNTSNSSNNNSSGNNGNDHLPGLEGDGDLTSPSVVCENPYWVANSRRVFMLGTPGFWISRHRCIFCDFATTCTTEALAHLSRYDIGEASYSEPPESPGCEYGCCDSVAQAPLTPPELNWWIMVYEPYYKYSEGVPGETIYLPDGTYTCMNCGRIKNRGSSSR